MPMLHEPDGATPQDDVGPALQFKESVVRDVVVDEQRIADDVLKHRRDWYAARAGAVERDEWQPPPLVTWVAQGGASWPEAVRRLTLRQRLLDARVRHVNAIRTNLGNLIHQPVRTRASAVALSGRGAPADADATGVGCRQHVADRLAQDVLQ